MSLHAVADATGLHVQARGWARLWGCSRGLELTRDQIADAGVGEWADLAARIGWRVGGTGLPRRFYAGWFTVRGRKGERAWLYADHGKPLLCVSAPAGHRPALVAISLDRVDVRPDADWLG